MNGAAEHLTRADLAGKTIDAHAHVGMSVKAVASEEYPYGQTLEGLYYRQRAAAVDVNVVFPYGADLFFDLHELTRGTAVPAERPLSPVPYGAENEMLFAEVFRFCPELSPRFLPFVSVDPAREVDAQMERLISLGARHPVYGIKISPVAVQSRLTELLGPGLAFLDFARERNIPFLFHTTGDPDEGYSRPEMAFAVIEENPDLRFCLAHCICFDRAYLEKAHALPNVWFDTAAMKIQVQMVDEDSPLVPPRAARFEADYTDHRAVTRALAEAFPETVIWGTDAPAYTYICRRKQAEGSFAQFRLKARYEDERAALDALSEPLRTRACNTNTLNWLFGPAGGEGGAS